MQVREIRIQNICVGDPKRFVLIAGPCVIEDEASALRHAEEILKVTQEVGVPYIYKASYDKANRSSVRSFRGPGLEKGLKILEKVRKKFNLPVLSDVHSVDEAKKAGEILDVIQIPAFLCRQTDILLAAAKTGRAVNVKKGQFLSPWDMKNVVEKLESVGCQKILLTDRGTTFGYQNLVSDFRAIPVMRGLGYPAVYDVTHSVQVPGGKGETSGGMAEFIPVLARCGVVAGADALFIEIHESPEEALSDGANSLALRKLKPLLEMLVELKKVVACKEPVLT
ncbi:MAG: 3-deoxy-8-phosphooctulonate synthase [Candidatus Omnitrophica bacterium]|nr:3-deoxy-8-phosphooctulonate synthase [Candidatus Omnitrophota bacterium]